MDEDARICGNWLVGNPADAAGLETYMGGLKFTTDGPLTLALTGTPGDSLQGDLCRWACTRDSGRMQHPPIWR